MKKDFLYNKKILKERRVELRNNQTEVEQKLWMNLKGKNLGGLKFQRQYSVGPYILDFYCPKYRFGIELDGSQHGEEDNKIYDEERSRFLEGNRIRIIRFWNNEISQNLKVVLDQIYNEAVKYGVPPPLI